MKYVLYLRKSSEAEDRQIMSLQSQKQELEDLASKLGLNIVEIYQESKSAKNLGRPEFGKMMAKIQKSKEPLGILTWKLDRLARNPIDGGLIIHLLQNAILSAIKTPETTHLPTDNMLPLYVIFGMANQYSLDLSTNVKRGNRTALSNGNWPRIAPIGYINKRDKNNNPQIIQDKDRAPLIKELFILYATGKYSHKTLSNKLHQKGLTNKGGKKIYKSMVERILKNPFYYGIMVQDNKHYKGNHKPIISKELFDQVQPKQGNTNQPRPKKHFYHLRNGNFTCKHCGCLITAEKQKGHIYYHCTNGKSKHPKGTLKYIREEELDKQLSKKFKMFNSNKELIEIMHKASKQNIDIQDNSNTQTIQRLQKQLKNAHNKDTRLLDVHLDGSIDKNTYDTKKVEISNEIVNLEDQISKAEQKVTDPYTTLELTRNAFLTSNRAEYQYLNLDPQEKHNILSEILLNHTLDGENIAELSYKEPYNILANMPLNASFSLMSIQ